MNRTPPIEQGVAAGAESVRGDFNGDGRVENAWVVPADMKVCKDCSGTCNSVIRFSDKTIPSIRLKSAIGAMITNHGDLNRDGADELGMLPSWCTSCWVSYSVYGMRANAWKVVVEPFSTYCDQWDQGVVPVERDPKRSGYVRIRYSEMSEDLDIVVRTKSVPIR
jgi:hypothetical protein